MIRFLSTDTHAPAGAVLGAGDNVLHHQLCFPQFLLQLRQFKVGWREKTERAGDQQRVECM